MSDESKRQLTERGRRAREHTVAGGALGALSVSSLAIFGSLACPICVVAAPALICSGLWNAHKDRKQQIDLEKSTFKIIDCKTTEG